MATIAKFKRIQFFFLDLFITLVRLWHEYMYIHFQARCKGESDSLCHFFVRHQLHDPSCLCLSSRRRGEDVELQRGMSNVTVSRVEGPEDISGFGLAGETEIVALVLLEMFLSFAGEISLVKSC